MIIVTSCWSQLGNQIILFAHFIAFAIENNLKIINLNFNKYAHFFESTNQGLICCYPAKESIFYGNKSLGVILQALIPRMAKLIDEYQIETDFLRIIKDYNLKNNEKFNLDNEEFQQSLKSGQIILSQGYSFRAYSLLEKYSDEIREYFTPMSNYAANVSSLIESLRRETDVLVGIHIRQGDYRTFLKGKYFYEIEQYTQMMRQVQSLFAGKTVKFLICSNVKQKISEFKEFIFSFATNHPLEDMYSLASCDYILGPSSSYTSWAAFYGKVPLYVVDDPASEITLESFQIYPTPMV